MESITVAIVDDHKLFRNGLKLLLSAFPELHITGEESTAEDFLSNLEFYRHCIVLMDISLPGMNGIEATQNALVRFSEMKIIALSMFSEEDYYLKMIEAGARGFLMKDADISEVYQAIREVAGGGSHFSQQRLFNLIRNLEALKARKEIKETR